MKKQFSIFALTLLAFSAVSCSKDGHNKFSPRTIEDFKGTVWSSDDNGIILNFLAWGEIEQKPTCSEDYHIPTSDYDELPAEINSLRRLR